MSDQKADAADTPSANLLVIEDEADTRAILSHSLKAAGYTIVEAVDGQDAIEKCKEVLPDIIVTDVMMPNIDGIEFVRWFRQAYPEQFVPILILTALSEIEDKVEGLDIGADDYLTKPFNLRELRARVHALLRIKRLTERLEQKNLELLALNDQLSEMQKELVKKERELVAVQLAGAAAHKLGQPITTIILNCRILEQAFAKEEGASGSTSHSSIQAIKAECQVIKNVLDSMQSVNPEKTQDYVDGIDIIDLDSKKESS